MHLIYDSKLPEGKMSPLNVGGCVGAASSRQMSGNGSFLKIHIFIILF